jgi:multidrug efflux system membrane fusion protein
MPPPEFLRSIACLSAFVLLLAACSEAPKKAAAPPPPQVTVVQPVTRTVVDHDEYVGRFVAVASVEIRARVSGYLDKVHFTDGQIVKEGDLLFTIDRRPFQHALEQARGELERARAVLAFAKGDLDRAATLVRDKTISQQVYDQRKQAQRIAEASITTNEALVRQAELNLEFTELRAPITGRIGDRRVSTGNLVTGGTTGNTTLLATIVSIDPIRFEFTFDEQSFLRFERLARKGPDVASRNIGAPVDLKLINEKEFSRKGQMDFLNNVIDPSTGTIRGRAQFSNPDGTLIPGLFARIRVAGSAPYEALLIPDIAVGSEQVRKYVMTVGPDNVAKQTFVTLGALSDGLRIVKSGLKPGDRIITEGLMRARPGMKVVPQEKGTKPGKPSAAAAVPAKTKTE